MSDLTTIRPRAVIADDEPHVAEHLRERLHVLWPQLQIEGIATNGPQALRLIGERAPEVVFLDIRMPGLNGLEVAARIAPETRIVFVTAFDQYAVDAFEREAVDYLLKPVGEERLARTVNRLKAQLQGDAAAPAAAKWLKALADALPQPQPHLRWIRASKGELTHQISVDEVLYFQARDKYVSVFTRDGESLIRTPLSELQARLDPAAFAQIHRSTIVNLGAVAGARRDIMGHTRLRLKDSAVELPVSRGYAELFKSM